MNIGSFIQALFTQTGPGGFVVLLVVGLAGTIYILLIRWILQGDEDEAVPVRKPRGTTWRSISE